MCKRGAGAGSSTRAETQLDRTRSNHELTEDHATLWLNAVRLTPRGPCPQTLCSLVSSWPGAGAKPGIAPGKDGQHTSVWDKGMHA